MGYELHVVRTNTWLESAQDPVTRPQVEQVVLADPELTWSTTDHLNGNYDFIQWNGDSCFYWEKDQIIGKSLQEPQIVKLSKIAKALDAQLIGDEDEQYLLQRSFFGRESVKVIPYGGS